jgi:hypothetical protein
MQPAIKLLDFFRTFAGAMDVAPTAEAGGAATFSTDKAREATQAMRDAAPISEASVASWVKFWQSKGLFA